jgi:hypothetical protein
MGVTVVVNFMTVSHKGSTGISLAFPDVCKTPTPAGPVPIPYPNIAKSGDTSSGSKTVKMDGQSIMLKGSNMMMSTGDEAGTVGGVLSGKFKGKAEFVNYSFDVKVDGKNVCRLLDPTQGNQGSPANTFAPVHLQGPKVVMGPQLKGCEETEKKQKEQKVDEKTAWKKSGIWSGHQEAIQRVANEEHLIIFFRGTNAHCADMGWIPGKHKPKPHEVIKAKTISGSNVAAVAMYLAKLDHWEGPPNPPKVNRTDSFGQAVAKAKTLYGVVMSLETHNKGEPLKGYGRDSNGYSYRGKWITGDYDLMDIQWVGGDCMRPHQDFEAEFGRIKRALNAAMGWDGIQHGPQAQYVSKTFSIPVLLKEWLKTGGPVPEVEIAEGRFLPVCDSKLTVVAPNKTIFVDDPEDVRNALICCGCGE